MPTEKEGVQMSLFDLGCWSSKTSSAHSTVTKAKTSRSSLRKSRGSQGRTAPMFLYLRGGWPKSGCISGVGIFGCPFSVAWRLHDGQFWGNALYDDEGNAIFRGTPQRRKRIALVADFGGLSAPEVLFVREGLSGNPQKGRETQEADSARTGGGTAEASRIYDARGNGGGGIAPTITGDHQNRITDYTAICVGNGQRDIGSHISPETSQTLSTMHDQLAVMVKDTAVAVDLYNQKVDGDKTMTLAAQRADPHHTPCVMQREE